MTAIFESLLRVSVEAALLALLVLGARLIVGRRPGVLLTVLYALVAVRLIMPFTVSSPLSLQNIWNTQQMPVALNTDYPANDTALDTTTEYDSMPIQSIELSDSPISVSEDETPHQAEPAAPLSAMDIAADIWGLGIAVFSGIMLTGNALFVHRIKRNRKYKTPEFAILLDKCKSTLHLNREIRVICASETGTAAVYGVFRPVLLISPSSFETLTEAQKRHVLLHELSHIRRRDTLVCAAATVLNIIHWFNPIVWIVFALMRRDIEIQCDAHVFRGLPDCARTDYAGTLLKLAGPVHTPTLAPALFISKSNIKRRITMIIKHRKASALFTAAALLLTIVVAVSGCTTAVDQSIEATTPEPIESTQVEETTAPPTPEPTESATPVVESELMASFELDNSDHDSANRMYNIQIAVDMLNDSVIKPGETLSLNEIFGPRNSQTAETVGWTEEIGIENGNNALQYGTGVCTVSTALYNAAIRAELEITEFRHCSMPVNYIGGGLDAVISTGGPDLKITNPYDTYVTIEAKFDGTIPTVSIYGPHRDYTVDFESESVSTEKFPDMRYVYNTAIASDGTNIPQGESYIFMNSIASRTYNVYKTRYDLDGNKIDTVLYETATYKTITGITYINAPDPTSSSSSSSSSSSVSGSAVTPEPTSASSAQSVYEATATPVPTNAP